MKEKITFVICVIIITVIVSLVLLNSAIAALLVGCPKDEIINLSGYNQCPLCGSSVSEVKEGYLQDGSRLILDTLSKKEKQELGIQGDTKLIVVIYKSPYTGEASFIPGRDKFGNELEKKFIHLQYDCNKILSTKMINAKCKLLGHNPEELEALRQIDLKRLLKETKESMSRIINESWPIFYKQHKESGFTDKEINLMWEELKNKIYEEYNYDPKRGQFKSIKSQDREYEYDPKTGSFREKKEMR